jgi:hypothetical protein
MTHRNRKPRHTPRPETVEEYGRLWDRRTPRGVIHRLAMRRHLSVPLISLKREVALAIRRSPDKYERHVARECFDYLAIARQRVRDLYNHAARGM